MVASGTRSEILERPDSHSRDRSAVVSLRYLSGLHQDRRNSTPNIEARVARVGRLHNSAEDIHDDRWDKERTRSCWISGRWVNSS